MALSLNDFTQLYRNRLRVVVRYIFVRVNDRELAEDLASEAFAIAWEKHLGGEIIDLRWLFVTARNLVGNQYQRRVRERGRLQRIGMEGAADMNAWGVEIESIELRLAVAQLRPAEALVLQLAYWQGLSSAEAAQFLDCSTVAFRVRLTRARAALRACIEDPGVLPAWRQSRRGEVDG